MSYSTSQQTKNISLFKTLPFHLLIFAVLIVIWELTNLYGFDDQIHAHMIAPRPTNTVHAMLDIFIIDNTYGII